MKEKILNRLSELIETNQLNNEDLVQIIEHVGSYLNLETISDYAKRITYLTMELRSVER